jgi:argininosuccinate lyase
MQLLTTMKGLPLAYNKDMQEDKEFVFDAIDTVKGCITLFDGMINTMKVNRHVMQESSKRGFTNATDAADYLVSHGVPFRDAHGIIGRLVLHCIDAGKGIEELTLEELQKFSNQFEEDVFEAISLRACVNRRLTAGAPGEAAMAEEIAACRSWLQAQ